jgi:tRNA (adenine22-N1)-methyltransferase
MRLGKRLRAVADFVSDGARLADIGSDHAKLPIFLVETGKVKFAIAGEVVKGPYEISLENTQNFSEIKVRLANGLYAIEEDDNIDTIVIAGMGGILISEILEARNQLARSMKRLIIQPNNEEAEIRSWLIKNDFKIVAEEILEEKGKIYEIIVAETGEMQLSELELKFGLYLTASETFEKKWKRRISEIDHVLSVLPENKDEERKNLEEEKAIIREILG